LAPNTARADLPALTSDDLPWITWLTSSRIPAYSNSRDRLIVTTPEIRESASRRMEARDSVRRQLADAANRSSAGSPVVGLIGDTASLETPRDLEQFSSQRLLWESIRKELLENPFGLTTDLSFFLTRRMIGSASRITRLTTPASSII